MRQHDITISINRSSAPADEESRVRGGSPEERERVRVVYSPREAAADGRLRALALNKREN